MSLSFVYDSETGKHKTSALKAKTTIIALAYDIKDFMNRGEPIMRVFL